MKVEKRKSFTLVEHLLVIAIVVILTAGLFHILSKSNGGRGSHCMSNLKQIGLAFHMYSQDNEGRFPADAGNSNMTLEGSLVLLKGYLDDPKVFICPDDKSGDITASSITNFHPVAGHCSYAFFLGLSGIDNPDWVIAFDDCANASNGQAQATNKIDLATTDNHGQDGVNILYVDGHCRWMVTDSDNQIHLPCGTNAYLRVAH